MTKEEKVARLAEWLSSRTLIQGGGQTIAMRNSLAMVEKANHGLYEELAEDYLFLAEAVKKITE